MTGSLSSRDRRFVICLIVAASALLVPVPALALPAGSVTEFRFSSHEESEPLRIAPGADGNLWFSINGNKAGYRAIGRISTEGTVLNEFSEGLTSVPLDLVTGPDGAVWFASDKSIGRATTAGLIDEFSEGLEGHEPERIGLGPRGEIWFTIESAPKFNSLGWITTSGEITVIPPSELRVNGRPHGVATGPEGNVWFTDGGSPEGAIGRVTPCGLPHCTTKPEEFTGVLPAGSDPESIVRGPDGNLWFTDDSAEGKIGRVIPCAAPCTPTIEEFKLGAGSLPTGIAAGADGSLWVSDRNTRIGHVVPCSPVPGCEPTISESPNGLFPGTNPVSIAPGPDGNVWFTATGSPQAIGRIGTGAPPALQSSPTIQGPPVAGLMQTCQPATWATWAGIQPSSTLFGFDGYSWQLDGTTIANGQNYTPSSAQGGHSLSCSETVTYPSPLLVTPAIAKSPSENIAYLGPADRGPQLTRPLITGLRQSAARWREGRKRARISAPRRKPPVGTTFSFHISESAKLKLVFIEHGGGRRVHQRCLAKSKRNARRPRCNRMAGTMSLTAHQGRDRISFQGRLSPHTRLQPGTYTMTLTATNARGLRSAARSLQFTILH
jgi:virginiamycin B lyase